jgi:arabinan endo-1,5-alpha-L-arabinosidase
MNCRNLREVLDCASPLALWNAGAQTKAAEGCRSPRRSRAHPAGSRSQGAIWESPRLSVSPDVAAARQSAAAQSAEAVTRARIASWPGIFVSLLVALGVGDCPADETNHPITSEAASARLSLRDSRIHDPSTIVVCKEEYWHFATGMGLVSRHSKDLVNWTNGPRVFTNAPAWTTNAVPGNRGYFWAPDVILLTNRYLLYYSVSTFGKNTSAIALATNPTLDPSDPDYAWTDHGIVVQSGRSNNFNAIDPAVTRDAEGNLWLAFGSYWSGIKLIQLDPATGKRIAPDSPLYSLAHNDSIEAPFLYRHENRYYLFVNWGACCRGTNSTYEIRVGRSEKITGPYLDRDGKDLMLGGGTKFLGSEGTFIGPGHAGIVSVGGTNWLSCHFYDGARRGLATLALRPLRWKADGWPEAGPLDPRRSADSR